MILETNWLRRECEEAWFAFGGHWTPRSLGGLRSQRPRHMDRELVEYSSQPPKTRLFIEPDFEALHKCGKSKETRIFLTKCLRIRSPMPRTLWPVVDERERAARGDALRSATSQVLDDPTGARPEDPPRFQQPPNFLYHVELVQRLAGWYPDGDQLINSFSTLAVRHANLHGRRETGEDDWAALARVAKDSIPPWISRAIEYLKNHGEAAPHLFGAANELRQTGLVEYHPRKRGWTLAEKHAEGAFDVVIGKAFQPQLVSA